MRVSVAEAKNKLPELIKAVEDGEQVTITRRGVPVVDVVRTNLAVSKKRTLGTLRSRSIVIDPGWWRPMTAEEADAFIEGHY